MLVQSRAFCCSQPKRQNQTMWALNKCSRCTISSQWGCHAFLHRSSPVLRNKASLTCNPLQNLNFAIKRIFAESNTHLDEWPSNVSKVKSIIKETAARIQKFDHQQDQVTNLIKAKGDASQKVTLQACRLLIMKDCPQESCLESKPFHNTLYLNADRSDPFSQMAILVHLETADSFLF